MESQTGDETMNYKHRIREKAGFIGAIGLMLFLSVGIAAQETSSSSTSGSTGGRTATSQDDTPLTGGYEIKSSIEFGVRNVGVDGNKNKFKSDLNYDTGVRIFDSSFYANALDSDGKPFDSLLITGSGWGGDPNGFARVNFEKIGWYKFDSMFRRFKYFNNVLNFALNEHNRDTVHNMGDFNLTLLPQNRHVRFRAGFSYDDNEGPGSTTFDYDRDEFPLEFQYDTESYDLRFGVDANVAGFSLSFTEGYRKFNDEMTWFIDGVNEGEAPGPAIINTFIREMPIEGKTHYHRFTAHRFFKGVADITGRFIYSDTETDFTLDERITGVNRGGNPLILDQYTATGNSSRPNANGDIGVTFFLGDRVQISDTFGVNSYRISGGHIFDQSLTVTAPPASLSSDLIWRFTNYRRIMNTLEGSVDVSKQFSFYLGYRYTDRKVELSGLDVDRFNPSSSTFFEEGDNTTNTFLAGLKAKPFGNKWRIIFDMEHGEGDNPFTRLANNDFTQFRVKNTVTPTDDFSFTVSFESKDNSNPGLSVSDPSDILFADVKSRTFGATFSYSPNPDFSLNGGYNYTYLNAETDVIFPTRNFGTGLGMSIYNLRNNYGFVDVWFRPHPKVSIFGAYRVSKDTGDGDMFDGPTRTIVGSYPLTFQSPEVRGTLKIFKNIDWNLGYQFYDYDEKFLIPIHGMMESHNYRAHMPYTSITIYFGRRE